MGTGNGEPGTGRHCHAERSEEPRSSRWRASVPGSPFPVYIASPPHVVHLSFDSMNDLRDRLQAALGDDYTVERELGGGGMSHVFLATERRLDRQVVIKLLPPDLTGGVSLDRFHREIQLVAKLQNPHIVPVIDI